MTRIDIDEYMTQADAARALGKSRQYVHKLLNQGKLHCVRVGSQVLVRKSDIAKRIEDAK